MPAVSPKASPSHAAPTPRQEVRDAVKNVLTQSKAFAQLPKDQQLQVARNTALVADYLAAPEGVPGHELKGGVGMPTARALDDPPPPPPQESYDDARKAVSEIGKDKFKAGAAREGAAVAGLFMKKVNFVDFVSGLIQGVFSSIVTSSIKQMEAYSKMIEQVAKSLQQFRDDNVTENQGRDHMVERFPDTFEIGQDDFSETPGAKLKLKDGVDENDALKRVQSSFKMEGGDLKSVDTSDENVEKMLVDAARMQLAKQRQQLLASLVLMGINRIVITDGRIGAKIMYDFQARDSQKLQRSAVAYDYARDAQGNIAKTSAQEGEYDQGGDSTSSHSKDDSERDANWFAKGNYKYSEQPIMSAMSSATEATDSQLQTRAQLSGTVEVNFKSDYLPLDKMATPGMIAAIQGNSTPVDPNVVPSPRNAPAAAPAATGAAPPAAAPATTATA